MSLQADLARVFSALRLGKLMADASRLAVFGSALERLSIPAATAAHSPELPVFRISQIFQNAATAFHDVAANIESSVVRLYQLLPTDLKTVVDQDVSIAKQYVSDTIGQLDSSLASHQQAIAMGVEEAIDTELALLTRGVSVPYNAFTNHAIDAMVATAVAAAHNAGLSIKARLASATVLPSTTTTSTSAEASPSPSTAS